MAASRQSRYFIASIGIAAGIIAAVSAALVLEFNGLALWGILLHAVTLISGLLAMLFCMSRLREPLSAAAESPGMVLDTVKTYIAQSGELREILGTEVREREAIIAHVNTVIDGIIVQFNEIETLVSQGIEVLNSIESYFSSLCAASSGQSLGLEQVDTHTSGIRELMVSLRERLGKSSGQAGNLEEIIAGGEAQVLAVNEAVRQISQDVETITALTGTINQISAQTNILSMNAAIESAHAGAAGAGFAVVADEIRKLSDLTRENAKNIRDVLSAMVQKTADALTASDISAQTLKGITEAVKDFARNLSGITEAAQEGDSISRDVESSIERQKDLTQTIKDGSADIVVHNQSFRAALDQIQNLTDKTRAEIKEIRSGTQEVLEHIQKTEQSFLKNLEGTEAMRSAIPEIVPKE